MISITFSPSPFPSTLPTPLHVRKSVLYLSVSNLNTRQSTLQVSNRHDDPVPDQLMRPESGLTPDIPVPPVFAFPHPSGPTPVCPSLSFHPPSLFFRPAANVVPNPSPPRRNPARLASHPRSVPSNFCNGLTLVNLPGELEMFYQPDLVY